MPLNYDYYKASLDYLLVEIGKSLSSISEMTSLFLTHLSELSSFNFITIMLPLICSLAEL